MIPRTRAYKTAIAEASVAVKRPITIPPITINSNNKLGKASIKLETTSLILLLLEVGNPFFFGPKESYNH